MGVLDRDKLNMFIDDDLGRFLLVTLSDLEGERAADVAETLKRFEDTKEKLEERFLSEAGQHEAMDRAFIAHEHVDSYLVNHPYVQLTPKAYQLAMLASMALAQLYQECGKAELQAPGTKKCSNCSQPLASGRGFLSSLKSCCSSFWSKMIKLEEPESL